jgi:hypothetical protein
MLNRGLIRQNQSGLEMGETEVLDGDFRRGFARR